MCISFNILQTLYDLKQVWLSAIFLHPCPLSAKRQIIQRCTWKSKCPLSAKRQIIQRCTWKSKALNLNAMSEFMFGLNSIKTWRYTLIHKLTHMIKR